MMLSEHTYKQFDAELEAVRASVLKMSGLVEEQITTAIEALITGNMDLADQVDANDHNVNALEVAIDEDCTHIIVGLTRVKGRRAPLARVGGVADAHPGGGRTVRGVGAID